MPPPDSTGPIAAALEQEITAELRRKGVVVWLDRAAHYNPFVDALAQRQRDGAFAYPVVAFRGSWLEVMLALEPLTASADNTPLLLHVPGHDDISIRTTPALELYLPGKCHRRSLDTLVRETAAGQVTPDALESFLAAPGLTLEAADHWLEQQRSSLRQETAGVLQKVGAPVVLDDLIAILGRRARSLHIAFEGRAELDVLEAFVHRATGMDPAWRAFYGTDPRASGVANLATALVAWLLAVEYVHDLARPPHLPALQPLRKLSPQLVATCRELAAHLRTHHPDAYTSLADEIEQHLDDEFRHIAATDLGRIDTFRCEEKSVVRAALDALRSGDAATALRMARERADGSSFWLQRDQARRWTWTLIAEAAELGTLITTSTPASTRANAPGTLDDALSEYTRTLYAVDRAHRRFEQKRATLLEPRLEHFADLTEIVARVRVGYRAWADALARDFAARCEAHGFLPDASLQQRTFYEQVVQPLCASGERVALFLVDALRYEMATEIADELRGQPGVLVDLKARFAELPTLTIVGMNALAPVAKNGRLTVAGEFEGFKNGDYTVSKPVDRARAMGTRSLGKPALRLELAEVCAMDAAALRRKVAQSKLVVVQSREIDDAGEANVGVRTFEATLRDLVAAYHHLRGEVAHVVFVADHGFLLQDETTRVQPFGTKRVPSRRHVVDTVARAEDGMVPVSVRSLGYDGVEGYLLFRRDTAVFATGNPGASFVHGGNSLQERVIPVLTITQRRAEAPSATAYRVEAEPLGDLLGLRRLRFRLTLAAGAQRAMGETTSVDVMLRTPERPEIRVTLKDTSGAGAVRDGRLQVPPGDAWTEVLFALEGPHDERARVELYHPDNVLRIAPYTLDAWFDVGGAPVARRAPSAPAMPAVKPPPSWKDAIVDEGARRVFAHLEMHDSISEAEATHLLGSARAFRRFSLEFETFAARVPFRVRIESPPDGKRYVKDSEK